jgi:hypothetical protein
MLDVSVNATLYSGQVMLLGCEVGLESAKKRQIQNGAVSEKSNFGFTFFFFTGRSFLCAAQRLHS